MVLRAHLFTTTAALGLVLGACAGTSEVSTSGNTTGSPAGGGGSTGESGGNGGSGGNTATSSSGGSGGTEVLACIDKTGATGDSELKISWGGLERTANVHVPSTYDPTKPGTLVLNFHGFSSNPEQQAQWSQMDAASDERNFIVVYPKGTNTSWNAGSCCGLATTQEIDDVGFVTVLLEKLEADYCIDPRRVFATGLSNGAFLSHRLGCELSGKIAAIAPVAGVIGIPLDECHPDRAVPVMHFHGTYDPLVPYDGGGVSGFISVADSIARWREINGCNGASEITFDKGDSQCVTAQGCKDGSEVTLCTVTGGGHNWPGGQEIFGGGTTSKDLDANNAMLDFFEAHPMP